MDAVSDELFPQPVLTYAEAEEWIEGETWTFAKTVPDHPHWYVVSARANDRERWRAFTALIRRDGTWQSWNIPDTPHWIRYQYLRIGEYEYWTGPPNIVNRREALHGGVAEEQTATT